MTERPSIPSPSDQSSAGNLGGYGKRLVLTLVAVIVLLLVNAAAQVFLLLFAGILFAIFLRSLSDRLAAHTRLGERWALLVVTLSLLLLLGFGVFVGTARLQPQVEQLRKTVPEAVERLKKRAEHITWGTPAEDVAEQPERYLPSRQTLLQRLGGIFSTTLGALSATVVVLFLGFCFAVEPRIYLRGVLHIIPSEHRPRWRGLMHDLNHTLSTWLFAKLASMTIVGILMWIGLSLLGIPLAFSLAVLAALLDFVPNIGPIIAGIPAVLFAFTQSPTTALHVLILYLVVQTLESYLITPFIERKTVSLPPALTGIVQLVLALLVGIPGVIVAAPLTAAGMIIVQRLYVEGALGERLDQDPLDDTGTPGAGASAPPRVTLQEEAPPPPSSPQQG